MVVEWDEERARHVPRSSPPPRRDRRHSDITHLERKRTIAPTERLHCDYVTSGDPCASQATGCGRAREHGDAVTMPEPGPERHRRPHGWRRSESGSSVDFRTSPSSTLLSVVRARSLDCRLGTRPFDSNVNEDLGLCISTPTLDLARPTLSPRATLRLYSFSLRLSERMLLSLDRCG